MRERSLPLLSSPAFLLALGLLLANDFLLKQQFHNAVTGKLSDVMGLFVFAWFWTAILPRYRAQVFAWTAERRDSRERQPPVAMIGLRYVPVGGRDKSNNGDARLVPSSVKPFTAGGRTALFQMEKDPDHNEIHPPSCPTRRYRARDAGAKDEIVRSFGGGEGI